MFSPTGACQLRARPTVRSGRNLSVSSILVGYVRLSVSSRVELARVYFVGQFTCEDRQKRKSFLKLTVNQERNIFWCVPLWNQRVRKVGWSAAFRQSPFSKLIVSIGRERASQVSDWRGLDPPCNYSTRQEGKRRYLMRHSQCAIGHVLGLRCLSDLI